MKWTTKADTRCGICRRIVDTDTRERTRFALAPLIVCDDCVREADQRWSLSKLSLPAAA